MAARYLSARVSLYLLLLGRSFLLFATSLSGSSGFLGVFSEAADQFVDEKSICNRSQLGGERILNPVTLLLRAGGR